MVLAPNFWVLLLGRFISGISCGVSMVVCPLYLTEIAPDSIRGSVGVMTQISVTMGILLTQFTAIIISQAGHWRYILGLGSVLAILQFLLLFKVPESPKWLYLVAHKPSEAVAVLAQIRGSDLGSHEHREEIDAWTNEEGGSVEAREMLLNEQNGNTISEVKVATVIDFLTKAEYRTRLAAVLIVLVGQQLSGINGVIFYSNSILSSVLPLSADLASVAISVIGMVTTFPAAFLIEKKGRKLLLITSLFIMCISSIGLCMGIVFKLPFLSILSSLAFVSGFGVGLGPIPFLLIGEIVEIEVTGAAQATGLAANWIATFVVGTAFPPLYSILGGYIFIGFAIIDAITVLLIRGFVPEPTVNSFYCS